MCHLCVDKNAGVQHVVDALQRSGTISDYMLAGLGLIYDGFAIARRRLVDPPAEPKLRQEIEETLGQMEIENGGPLDLDDDEDLSKAMLVLCMPALQHSLAKLYGGYSGNFGTVIGNLVLSALLVEAWLDGEDDDETTTPAELYERDYADRIEGLSVGQGEETARSARQAIRETAAQMAQKVRGTTASFNLDELDEEQRDAFERTLDQLEALAETLGIEPPPRPQNLFPDPKQEEVIDEETAVNSFNEGVDAFLAELQQQANDEKKGEEQ